MAARTGWKGGFACIWVRPDIRWRTVVINERSQAFQFIIALGFIFAAGLLTGAVFAWMAERPVMAVALAVAGVVDVVAFAVLYRLDPSRVDTERDQQAHRQKMDAHLQHLHAIGELDDEQLLRARQSLASRDAM